MAPRSPWGGSLIIMTPFCRRNTENWSEGKSVEVSRIKSRARGRVEVGCVLADLLERVGIEGQVEVAVLRHDPSGCMWGRMWAR